MTLAVSSCMVVPMVIIMSLYGACEGLFHMPGGPLANLQMLPMMWLINIPRNFHGSALESAGGRPGCSLCLPSSLPHGHGF